MNNNHETSEARSFNFSWKETSKW